MGVSVNGRKLNQVCNKTIIVTKTYIIYSVHVYCHTELVMCDCRGLNFFLLLSFVSTCNTIFIIIKAF